MSVDQEDFKMSGSFINPQDLTFIMWKYKGTGLYKVNMNALNHKLTKITLKNQTKCEN